MPKARPVEERFWEKVDKTVECWVWTASRSPDGYGLFKARTYQGHGGAMVRAHRFAWELTNGPVPDGFCVCHRCDNPSCCNPDHLFLGTVIDNNADRDAKGRQSRGEARRALMRTCAARGDANGARKNPHLYRGEASARAKLREDDVREIRNLYVDGQLSQAAIAARFGLGPQAVGKILLRKRWAHVQ